MVTINPIQAGRGLDPGGVPDTRRDDGIGQGLRQLGGAVSQAGATAADIEQRLIQQRRQIEEFQTEQSWAQTQLRVAAGYDEAKGKIDPSGAGFTESVNKEFISQYDTFLQTVPDYLKPRFSELVATDKEGRLLQASADEVAQRNAWYEVGVGDAVKTAQNDVASYPEAFDQKLSDVYRTIDATGLPPAKKADLKRSADQMLGRAWFERLMRDDPAFAKTQLGVGESDRTAYFNAIRTAESGGDPNAKNPNSSATGLYQFTESTWDGLMRDFPAAGLTKDGRTKPAQQEVAVRLFTAGNEDVLRKAGVATTNANLYAAHFLGAQGASSVLRASNDTQMSSVVEPEVIAANPFLKGMTVGDFKAWTSRKTGGDGSDSQPAPQVAALSFSDRLTMFDQASAAQQSLATQAAAQAKADYESTKGALELAIEKGEVASDQSILTAPLSDGDKATLLSKWKSEQGKENNARLFLDAYSAGQTGQANPYDSDQRKIVGDAYELLMGATDPAKRGQVTADYVRSTGVVPDQVVASTRQNLASPTTANVVAGLEQAAMLQSVAPDGLAAADHGKEITDAAGAYDHFVNDRGMAVDEAARLYAESRDPKVHEKTEVLRKSWTEAAKGFSINDVTGAFGAGWFGGPSAGVTPAQTEAMLADYLDIAEEKFVGPANGDPALAKKLALDEVKKTYGVSKVSGSDVLMKYPPEQFYPAIEGAPSYVRDLALKDARSIAASSTNVMLVATPETAQDVRAGQPPRYNLFYQNADGVWDVAPQMFQVSPTELGQLSTIASEERRINFEAGRKFDDMKRALLSDPSAVFAGVGSAEAMAIAPDMKPDFNMPAFAQEKQQLVNLDEQRKRLLGTLPNTSIDTGPQDTSNLALPALGT